jgi:indolepyruvate ferredoxin oxidoreductase beta subunit
MSGIRNILLVGVGGQGTILAGKILSSALVAAGFDVKMSEVHGMAQRGGSVSTQVRFGTEVSSPIFGRGEADFLVAFEELEALRWIGYLKRGGRAIVNLFRIPPAPVLAGKAEYPAEAASIVAREVETIQIDAAAIAKEAGSERAMNVVLLGALARAMEQTSVDWRAAIKACVKPATLEVNIAAFDAGYKRRTS